MKFASALAVALMLSGSALATEPMTATAAPVAVAAPTPAPDAKPEALVKQLYEGYYAVLNAGQDKPDAESPAWYDYARNFFTPELNARLDKSNNAEGVVIDVDMLIVGQDYQNLKVLDVTPKSANDKDATVAIKTSNMGGETTSEVKLVKTADGWRISDIMIDVGTKDAFGLDQALKEAGF